MIHLIIAALIPFQALALSLQDAQAAANTLVSQLNIPSGCLMNRNVKAANSSRNLAAMWLRTAFHDAGTFNINGGANRAGADGTVRFLTNIGVNNDIHSLADSYLDSGLKSRISAADTIQLAGAVAVTHCGGPQIPFQGGRIDNPRANPSVVSQLPGPGETYQQVIAKFARMGMNKTRMAVLVTGSHSLGGVTTPNGGRELFDDTPGVFDNHIFKRVLTGSCVLPIDCQIASDPDLRPLIQRYANDQNAFFADYVEAFKQMLFWTPAFERLDQTANTLNIPQHTNLAGEGKANQYSGGRYSGPSTQNPTTPSNPPYNNPAKKPYHKGHKKHRKGRKKGKYGKRKSQKKNGYKKAAYKVPAVTYVPIPIKTTAAYPSAPPVYTSAAKYATTPAYTTNQPYAVTSAYKLPSPVYTTSVSYLPQPSNYIYPSSASTLSNFVISSVFGIFVMLL